MQRIPLPALLLTLPLALTACSSDDDDNGSSPGNQPPTAAFTIDCTDLTCTFTDDSVDPDGSIASWQWDFGDGATDTMQNPEYTYADDTGYSACLVVTDNDGAASAEICQDVPLGSSGDEPPVAAFTFECTGLSCAFTDTSTDDGTLTAWAWDFGDSTTSTEQNPSATYAAAGTYKVMLTVTDDGDNTAMTSQDVTLDTGDNQAPEAAFTFECSALTCTFTDASTDADGTLSAWAWDFGDGTGTATDQNPEYSYTATGTFPACLTVTDDLGSASEQLCQDITLAGTQFTVLHTNDHHGRFWENADGEYGMAARKTLIDQITAEVEGAGGAVLLLSGGDINTGVPESDLQDAVPDFTGMNLLGYDAMAVGNHEFDNKRDVLEAQRALAEFPFLSANIYETATATRLFDSHASFTVNGLSIAVIGLTTVDTPITSNPDNTLDLEFRDPATEAATLIPEIIAGEAPDLVFAVTHMGHYENGNSGSNAPGDVALARALDPGLLDLIVGGHSQNPVCVNPDGTYAAFNPGDPCVPDMQNGTYIVQAEEWGKYLGRADLVYIDDTLVLTNYALIPVNLKDDAGNIIGETIVPDADVLAALQPFQDAGAGELDEVVAVSDGRLEGDRAVVRVQQTNLGRLIATAQWHTIRADFGLVNSGGVRASIEAGDIQLRDIYTVQPFGNVVAEAEMTGAEVQTYLGQVATKTGGGYPQIVGVTMTVDCAAEPASAATITEINGSPFSEGLTYNFSIPNFSANGGDGYPVIATIESGIVDATSLSRYLEFELGGVVTVAEFEPGYVSTDPLVPGPVPPGEITYLNGGSDSCEAPAP